MSYIPCTANCEFQKDGLCELNYTTVVGVSGGANACIHYIPKCRAVRNAQWHAVHPQYSLRDV